MELAVNKIAAEARASKGTSGFVPSDYVAGQDLSAGKPTQAVEWISINGGKFTMGSGDGSALLEDAGPIQEVAIKTFEMSKTLVTVEQYAECVINGGCTEPERGSYCNWGQAGRQRHPINCVDWDQANQYAKFKGARLPSDSEWEYAATSGGKNQKYPWGADEPTCEKAVMKGNGCGTGTTMPVCSKPAGNTAQGLCDMAGNVWHWVQDKYQNSYAGAPADGTAFEGAGSYRVVRGSSFINEFAGNLRDFGVPENRLGLIGFRLARSSR